MIIGAKPLIYLDVSPDAVRKAPWSNNSGEHMRTVQITREPVELYKILKFEGLVTTGGEAKLLIGDGQVTVNGAIETRRRKKIVNGDIIEFRGTTLLVQLV